MDFFSKKNRLLTIPEALFCGAARFFRKNHDMLVGSTGGLLSFDNSLSSLFLPMLSSLYILCRQVRSWFVILQSIAETDPHWWCMHYATTNCEVHISCPAVSVHLYRICIIVCGQLFVPHYAADNQNKIFDCFSSSYHSFV